MSESTAPARGSCVRLIDFCITARAEGEALLDPDRDRQEREDREDARIVQRSHTLWVHLPESHPENLKAHTRPEASSVKPRAATSIFRSPAERMPSPGLGCKRKWPAAVRGPIQNIFAISTIHTGAPRS